MRALALSWRPTGSALHRARGSVAIAYVGALCGAALLYDHPAVLAGALAGVVAAGIAAGVGPEIRRAAWLALPLALLVAVVNPIVARQGLTVLVSGPVVPVLGRVDLTLEAAVWGAIAGLRVIVVVLSFALFSAVVDPDALLRSFRRIAFRSALAASLATRLVPVLGRDAVRLAEAYQLRAARPEADGRRFGRTLRAAVLTRALAAGALERAVDLAAALEVRGYAIARRSARAPRPLSIHDVAFAASALAIGGVCAAGLAAGAGGFEAYPRLDAETGAAVAALSLAIPALALAPFGAFRLRKAVGRRARAAGGRDRGGELGPEVSAHV